MHYNMREHEIPRGTMLFGEALSAELWGTQSGRGGHMEKAQLKESARKIVAYLVNDRLGEGLTHSERKL